MSRAAAAALALLAGACAQPYNPENYDSGVYIADAELRPTPDQDAAANDAAASGPGFNQDVLPILTERCNFCHGAVLAANAPMSLVTYAQVTASYTSARSSQTAPVYTFIASAVEDTAAPMPPGTELMPSNLRSVISAWVAIGAPENRVDPPDGGAEPADVGPPEGGPPDADFADVEATDYGAPANPLPMIGAPEVVQNGYGFTEGPLWIPSRGVLIFSDLDQNRLYEFTPPNTFNVFREPSNVGNGNALDIRGRLLTCEHGSHSVVRGPVAGGATSRVASMFEGRGLNSPNDITVRSDGVIYFTDPPYGGTGAVGFNGLFRLVERPAGALLTAEWRGEAASRPNGVIFAPDERFLYMANTAGDEIMMFDVALSGALANPRTFVRTTAAPDGMGIDAAGNFYVAVTGGIEAFALDGQRWGLIPMTRTPSNIAWGDADRQTLYITAGPELYRLRMPFAGVRD